jgi:hypothetical protein
VPLELMQQMRSIQISLSVGSATNANNSNFFGFKAGNVANADNSNLWSKYW